METETFTDPVAPESARILFDNVCAVARIMKRPFVLAKTNEEAIAKGLFIALENQVASTLGAMAAYLDIPLPEDLRE